MPSLQPPASLLDRLASLFYPSPAALGQFSVVAGAAVPPPYRKLLDHQHHMTVTLEAYHRCPLTVDVLAHQLRDNEYARTSLLRRSTDRATVQFGIMRIDLRFLDEPPRREVESRTVPLGRTLIRHGVLRRVELVRLYRIEPAPLLRDLLALPPDRITYGRTARIHVDGVPAVDLLEIVGDRAPSAAQR